jgi:hypothetical protein
MGKLSRKKTIYWKRVLIYILMLINYHILYRDQLMIMKKK